MTLKIDNCIVDDFEFICPKQWSELKSSYVEGIRHCNVCKKNVYWCRSPADVKLHVSVNHCIAIGAETYEEIRTANEAKETARLKKEAETAEKANQPDDRLPFVGIWRPFPPK